MVLAERPDRFGFAAIVPPLSDVPLRRLLLRISPAASTLKLWYWLSEMPAALGAVMLTTGTPLPLIVIFGAKTTGAVGSVIGAADTVCMPTRRRNDASERSTVRAVSSKPALPVALAANSRAADWLSSNVTEIGLMSSVSATHAAMARCHTRIAGFSGKWESIASSSTLID